MWTHPLCSKTFQDLVQVAYLGYFGLINGGFGGGFLHSGLLNITGQDGKDLMLPCEKLSQVEEAPPVRSTIL